MSGISFEWDGGVLVTKSQRPLRVDPTVNPSMRHHLDHIISFSTRQDHLWGLSYLLGYLQDQGLDPETVDLVRFRRMIFGGQVADCQPCPPELVAGYSSYLAERAPDIRIRLISIARSYLHDISSGKDFDLSLALPRLRGRRIPFKPRFSADEVRALLSVAKSAKPLTYLLIVLLLLGYRPQEIGRLRWDLIDEVGATMYVFGKTRDQSMPMPRILVDACRGVPGPHRGPVFPKYLLEDGKLRGPTWNRYINDTLKRLCGLAGIRLGSAYWCRRSAA